MAAAWKYKIAGREFAAVSSQQLKQLALDGTIQPSDQVQRVGDERWVAASAVKGLFASTAVAGGSAGVVTNPPPPVVAGGPHGPAGSPGALPSEAEPRATCVEWYMANLGHQWLFAQLVLWVCYGFIWIPLWWLATRSSLSQAEAQARRATPREPIVSYVIALFCVPFVTGMLQRTRVEQERRVKQQTVRAAQESQRQVPSGRPPGGRSSPRATSQSPSQASNTTRTMTFPEVLQILRLGMSGNDVISQFGRPDAVEKPRLEGYGGPKWRYTSRVINDITQKTDWMTLEFDSQGLLSCIVWDGKGWQEKHGVRTVSGGYRNGDAQKFSRDVKDFVRQLQ